MGRAATLVALLSASCVSSSSNVCEDGSICPGGFVCDAPNHRCLLPEQVSLCEGLPEGEPCTFENLPGACRIGACIPYFCGDEEVTAGEECEPTLELDRDCKDFGAYVVEGLQCSLSCTYDPGNEEERTGCFAGPFCGDDTTNGPELCDAPESRTCVSIGFDAGTTTCNESCSFTIADCSRFGWNPESLSDVVANAVAGSARGDQWAFGLDGHAMHFEGAYWITVPTGVQNTLINGWSFSKSDAWAVGQSRASGPTLPSVVIHWDGTIWSTVANVPAGEYLDVWGPTSNEVYVASGSGIHKFNGSTWSTLPALTGTPVTIRGTSGSDIWVSTSEGPLMHFNGTAWTDLTPKQEITDVPTVIRFLDANATNDVWAIGYLSGSGNQGKGVIAHYTSGTDWDVTVTDQETYNAVASSASNDVWVAGVDGIMRHWDGVAWSRSANIGSSPSGLTALSGLISLGPDEVVGVSTLNLAYRYRGQAFGLFKPLGVNPFDAPENSAVWGTAANNQWVVNVVGEIWHFDGVDWNLDFTVPGGISATDIWGTAANDIWMVANDGNAYHYNGTDWTPFAVAAIPLVRVWSHASGDVWAFDAGGAYRKNGNAWDRTALGAGRVVSVSGSSPSNLWAVQVEPSSLWHFDGANWTEVDTGSTFPEVAVAALADNDVHITAEDGRFERWNGTAWTETVVPVLDDIRYLSYTAQDDVVGASDRDLVHFNGTSWSTVRTPVDFVPNTTNYLPIKDLHVYPGRIDMLLTKFRIRTLIRTRPLICRDREDGTIGQAMCGDAVDNDCDGMIDALDSECTP